MGLKSLRGTLIGLGVAVGVAALVAALLLVQRPAVAQEPPSSTYDGVGAPEPAAAVSPIPCTGSETVALIQDNVPWNAPAGQDPLGADVNELKLQLKNFCIIQSSELAAAALGGFGEILIAAAQTQTFYDTLFLAGNQAKLTTFVLSGGILSANLADHASGPGAGGNWDGKVFVGGLTHVFVASNNDTIAAPANPIIADAQPCPSGNCAVIVDTGAFTDLDGWGFSDHGHFATLPGGTLVIMTQAASGLPVVVEYPWGTGKVIALMTTTEWRYVGGFGGLPQNKKLLANEIAYQDELVCGALCKLEAKADRLEVKVDQGIGRLEGKADRLEGKADGTGQAIGRLEGKADRLEGKADKLETKVDLGIGALEAKADKHAAETGGINDAFRELVARLEAKLDRIEGKLDKIEVKLDTAVDRIALQVIEIQPKTEYMVFATERGVPITPDLTECEVSDEKTPLVFVDVGVGPTGCTLSEIKKGQVYLVTVPPVIPGVASPTIFEFRVSHGGHDGAVLFDRRSPKNMGVGQ